MMRTIKKLLILTVLAIACAAPASARSWEQVRPQKAVESKLIVRESEVEVRAGRGTIIVTTNHSVQVKVYSILGQLISQETIPAGTSRLQISSHGVFIVKIGDLTCKVAL